MANTTQLLQRPTKDTVGKRAPKTNRGEADREPSKTQQEDETRRPGRCQVIRQSHEKKSVKTG